MHISQPNHRCLGNTGLHLSNRILLRVHCKNLVLIAKLVECALAACCTSSVLLYLLHLDNGMEWLMSRSFPLNGSGSYEKEEEDPRLRGVQVKGICILS